MTVRLDPNALRTLHQVTSDAVRHLSDEAPVRPAETVLAHGAN